MKRFLSLFPHVTDALLVAMIGCTVLATGCGSGSRQAKTDAGTDRDTTSTVTESPPAEVLGKVPPFQLTDQSGASFDSQSLAGKVWVANFFFTRCQATCPKQSLEVKQLHDLAG